MRGRSGGDARRGLLKGMARKKVSDRQLGLGLDDAAKPKVKKKAGPAERSERYRPRSKRTRGVQWQETPEGIKKCWTVKDGPNKGKKACLTIEK